MVKDRSTEGVDDVLLRRLAEVPESTQRWLKTAIHTIRMMPLAGEDEAPPAESPDERESHPSPLEDVITGRASLREQLESFPELEEEMEGIGDVIDMLRELGESRRKKGRDILRDEILGEAEAEDEGGEGPPPDEDDEGPFF